MIGSARSFVLTKLDAAGLFFLAMGKWARVLVDLVIAYSAPVEGRRSLSFAHPLVASRTVSPVPLCLEQLLAPGRNVQLQF